jgi:CHAT domain-containing protein
VLHDVPWGVLPTLAGRTVSVNPSVTAWAKAAQASASRLAIHGGVRTVGLVAGPGLAHAAAEVEALSQLYASASALGGLDATVPRSLELVGGSDVMHVACHGAFRADNPMFSSLELADGPLVVYDFERLSRLPEVVVLSACSLANSKVLQGGSVLGLAAALTTLGAASVIAPLTPISDSSSVEVMCRLHRAMAAGATPAAALACASTAERAEQRSWTAGSFVALGA